MEAEVVGPCFLGNAHLGHVFESRKWCKGKIPLYPPLKRGTESPCIPLDIIP